MDIAGDRHVHSSGAGRKQVELRFVRRRRRLPRTPPFERRRLRIFAHEKPDVAQKQKNLRRPVQRRRFEQEFRIQVGSGRLGKGQFVRQ
jgi:hypothetical protein